MIGQLQLQKQIEYLINNNSFPHAFMLIGNKGSGRKTIAQLIADKLNIQYYQIANKMDDIRQLILDCQTTFAPTLFVIDEANTSAILKVIEEIPNNMYFCITAQSEYNTLPTIKSRCSIFHLQPYSKDELRSINPNVPVEFCDTVQEVQELEKYDYDKLVQFIKKINNEIYKQSFANILLIKENIKQYDLTIFLKAFLYITDRYEYKKITDNYLQDLNNINGIDKDKVLDNWLINIRELE